MGGYQKLWKRIECFNSNFVLRWLFGRGELIQWNNLVMVYEYWFFYLVQWKIVSGDRNWALYLNYDFCVADSEETDLSYMGKMSWSSSKSCKVWLKKGWSWIWRKRKWTYLYRRTYFPTAASPHNNWQITSIYNKLFFKILLL